MQNDATISSLMRYAILCNGKSLNAWEARCIEHLARLPNPPHLALAIIDGAHPILPPPKRNALQKLRAIGPSNFLYYFYCRHFYRPESTNEVPIEPFLKNTKLLTTYPTSPKKGVQVFDPRTLQVIREEKIDFILRFGFNILSGEILTITPYGVWSFHHDDETKYRGGPPAFWEVLKGDPVTGAILQKLTEKLDAGVVLKKGLLKTVPFSQSKNVDQIYWESSKWPAQVCHRIQQGTLNIFELKETKTKAKIYRNPKNFQMLQFLFQLLKQNIKVRISNWFRQDIWSVGVLKKPIEAVLKEETLVLEGHLEHPDKNSFLADPFAVYDGKNLDIFCESYSYKNPIGKICHLKFPEGKDSQRTDLSFSNRFHRSYPFIFQENGNTFILSECHLSNKIEIAKLDASNAPSDFTTLIEGIPAVDPTLFKHQGKYWLSFTREDDGPNSHLHLWYSDNLFDGWKPHTQNPVKIDITGSRPAGSVFSHEGRLYRPAQNCAFDYGYQVVIQEVTTLTPDSFEEREIKRIGPLKGKYSEGVHTISAAGPYTLIDMKRKKMVWPVVKNLLHIRTGLQIFSESK